MEYEAARKAPPVSFPDLPDIPGGRYTDPRFHALEKAGPWRKSWLIAAHMDEIAEPGVHALGNRRPADRHHPCPLGRGERLLQHLQPTRRAGREARGRPARLFFDFILWR